jgi:carbamoyl-phosphate synthase large subunit
MSANASREPGPNRNDEGPAMNVLLTCAGRRNYLVRYFKDALAGRGEVIACDCSPVAPALRDADRALIVPPLDDAAYLDALLSICRAHAVRLIISLIDPEVTALAADAYRFRAAGATPVVPPPWAVAACNDKWATFGLLRDLGLQTPETVRSLAALRAGLERGTLRFPLVIKPRWGNTSVGVEHVANERELDLALGWLRVQVGRSALGPLHAADPEHAFLFQERLPGPEYGLDVVNDLTGGYACTLARRKLAMRAGNTDRAAAVSDPALEQLGRTLSRTLGHLGSLDCDVIATDQGYSVLDLNPRFGGGYVFSHAAGANIPAALIAWARGEAPNPAWLRVRPGVVAAKYDEVTVVDQESPSAPPVLPLIHSPGDGV